MRALMSMIGDKMYFWRKKRQLRKDSINARREQQFWSAVKSPSGDPEVVAMIEQRQAAARDMVSAAG
ncbi:MAG: hypothetical protein V4611_01005 [Patescibacteria group bacterium]